MVRPNQIVETGDGTLTFLMFARSESQVKRRVLLLNFPRAYTQKVINREPLDKYVTKTELVTEGRVNRYKVTVDLTEVS